MNNEIKMIIGIVVLCVILMGAFIWATPKSNSVGEAISDPSLLVRENSRMTGTKDAKVTLVEFSDFQCPACASVAPYIKNIVDSYQGNPDFNFVYRYFPLPQHANAVISAEAVEAAGAQNKYWEMFDLIFAKQAEWATEKKPIDIFVSYAASLSLDTVQFKADLEQGKFRSFVQADLQDSQALGISSTPTFFLNGVKVLDLSNLKALIDAALAQ